MDIMVPFKLRPPPRDGHPDSWEEEEEEEILKHKKRHYY